jgi:nucleoside-diphosphate-sugar epimerase
VSRYLVTGAAGFIGSHLLEALLEAGHDATGLDCFTDYYDPALKEDNARGLPVTRSDVLEADLEALVSCSDGVFHLAAQPGVRRSFGEAFPEYVRQNVLATQRIAEAAAQAGARLVLASSSSIYGEAEAYPTPEATVPRPISPYGMTKLAAEHLIHAYVHAQGLDAVVLRYFTVYGPRQRPDMAFTRIVRALADDEPFELYGDGSASRGFTYVRDAVEATVRAMEAGPPGAVYNVGGGSEATMAEAIALLERIAGGALRVLRSERQAGDVRRTSADTTRIESELGWRPSTRLEDGLEAQWRWATSRVAARR